MVSSKAEDAGCPMALLTIQKNCMIVHSALFLMDGQFVISPIARAELVTSEIDERPIMRIARIVRGLRRFRDNIESELSNTCCSFWHPSVTSGTLRDGTSFDFEYLQLMASSKYRPIYEGRMKYTKTGEMKREIVIKFTRTYCEEAHQSLANCGCAPNLYSVNKVFGGWLMVVMDKVCGIVVDPKRHRPLDALEEDTKLKVKEVVAYLHEKGYVHGDLRGPNVLITQNSEDKTPRPVIIDFDWAGKIGEAKYPVFLNPAIEWPDGAIYGSLIKVVHDLEWIDMV